MKSRKISKKGYIFIGLIGLILLLTASIIGYKEYDYRFSPFTSKQANIKIYPQQNIDSVANKLYEIGAIENPSKLIELYSKQTASHDVKTGNYNIPQGISLRTLIYRLKQGRQDAVKITFNNLRTIERLAGSLAKQTMSDSLAYLEYFRNDSIISRDGFNAQTILAMFLPNTYEVYWNITPEQLYQRMNKEYNKFWNEERREKAKNIGLTPIQVSILSSIVIEETKSRTEMARIAGVYINRLKIGMPLQADPTVKFAVNDPTIKRILFKHLEVDSPYNTYKYKGLPPGMIAMPSLFAIDSTLDYEKHDYLYFCAKADMSGLHSFAKTLTQHNNNARAYANELNRRGIRK